MSDIKWYSSLPEHWEEQRTKYLFKIISGNGFPIEMQGRIGEKYPFAKAGTISSSQRYLKKANDSVSQDDVNANGFNVIPVGSIVMPKIGEALKKNSRAITSEEVCIDNNCQAMVPQNIDTDFAFYLLSVIDMNWYDNKGTIPSVNNQSLKNDKVPYPPLAEQQAIVSYLDSTCSAIDEAIERHKKIIEKLEEYRKSVITAVVMKGLNNQGALKNSGVEFIGDIPETWNISRLMTSCYVRARLGWRGLKADEYVEKGYAFISAFNIQHGTLVWKPLNYITQERYDESPEIKIHIGDILLVKDGAGVGKSARVDELPEGETSPNSSLAVITPNKDYDYRYVYYYLQSKAFDSFVLSLYNGLGVPHLTHRVMRNIKLPMPSIEEQSGIADYLDDKNKGIRTAIIRHNLAIEKLEEYRKSIIYNAVTGKIDCRKEAAR